MPKTLRTPAHDILISSLIAARKAAGLSQMQLAAQLKCHQSFIARIESGQRRIDVVELAILCRAIGAAPEEITKRVAEAVDDQAGL